MAENCFQLLRTAKVQNKGWRTPLIVVAVVEITVALLAVVFHPVSLLHLHIVVLPQIPADH